MGDLIQFPQPDQELSDHTADGTTVYVPAQREDQDDQAAAPGDADTAETPGAELDVPDAPVPPALSSGKALARRARELTVQGVRHAPAAISAGWQATAPGRAHLAYVWTGARDVNGRAWARLLHRDITAAIRQARADRNYGKVAALEQQRRDSANARWQRIKTMFEVAEKATKAAGCSLAIVTTLFVLATVGFAIYGAGAAIADALGYVGGGNWDSVWTHGYWATVTGTAEGIAAFVSTAWSVVTTVFPWLAVAGVAGGVAALHRTGKHSANLPDWARSATGADEGTDYLDEGAILGALRNLGLSGLDKAFKSGWGTPNHPARVWEMGLGPDGKGQRCQIRLPQGVPVSEVNRKKERLAHNLGRHTVEVWVSEPKDKAGVLDLWIADQGVLTEPVEDWPLLAELATATADYFTGVPVGVNVRGDQVTGQLNGKNWASSGMMGSGKSTLVITTILGAMLDPLVDIDVFVMAQNGDYELMRPRLRTLVTGAGEETVEAAMANLRELYAELEVRGNALAEHTRNGDPDAEKVTRRLAEKDSRLRPRIMVVDECQALFMHEKYGGEAQRLAVLLMNAARKYAITLMFLTPEPSTESLPRKLMAVMSNKACFAIGDQQSNDAILGTGSYKRGVSAVGLEPATEEGPGDVGTAMTSAGFLAKPGLLRSYYVPRSHHQAIVQRALEIREAAHITTEAAAPEKRDPVADALAVMGTEPARAAQVADAMGARWSHYQGWGIKDLVEALAAEGIRVPSTDRKWMVDPVKLRETLAARDE